MIKFIVKKMVTSGVISNEDKEIYEYGVYQGMIDIFNLLSIVLVGYLFDCTMAIIIFTVGFRIFRKYAGGFHASTRIGCYVLTMAMIFIVAFCENVIEINTTISVLGVGLEGLYLWWFAPTENLNNPLTEQEISIYREKNKKNILLFTSFFWGGILFRCKTIVLNIFMIFTWISIASIAERIKNNLKGY